MKIYGEKTMKSALEAMMFVSGDLLSAKDASEVLGIGKNEAIELFHELKKEYDEDERGIRIREVNNSFQFVTDESQEIYIRKLCTPVKVKRLSQAALEVLAIVAYKQPVTRGEIDSIRGIKCERVLDGLISKGLINITGRSDGVGRPLLYGTTDEFLKKFGLETLSDLPDFDDYSEDIQIRDREDSYAQLNMNFYEEKIDEDK